MKSIKFILLSGLLLFSLVTLSPASMAEMTYAEYQVNLTRLLMLIEQSNKSFQKVEEQLNNSKLSLERQKAIINEQTSLTRSLQIEIDYWKESTNHFEKLSTSLSEKLRLAEETLKKQEELLSSYKKTVEKRIRSLIIQRNIAAGAAVILGIIQVL